MLTAQWTHRLPVLQAVSPAELAAEVMERVIGGIEDIDTEEYTIVDFCSGAGGPIPFIEKSLNRKRASTGTKAIPFRLSDIHPHIDAWIEHASHSANLSFIPQPVDATSPPPSVISKTASSSSSSTSSATSGTKTLHLFCLAFHHFSDAAAEKVMRGVLHTSDGFAVLELQDRRLGTLLLMSLEWLLLYLLTVVWFPMDLPHLLLTYAIPVLPFVQCWDGLVSCLRTRSWEEMVGLVEGVLGEDVKVERWDRSGKGLWGVLRYGREEEMVVRCGEWRLLWVRRKHTWPFGYLNAVVGVPVSPKL